MSIKLGAFYWGTDYGPQVTEVAKMAEAAGCESFWVPEHTHVPLGSQSVRPSARAGESDGVINREFSHMLDPFVALAAAAAVTTTMKVGTSILLVPIRDPILTAKAVATLDHISGGRAMLGVGAGWLREELADHGIDPDRRYDLLREHVEAMKAIWTEEEPSYEGELVRFDRCLCWPKPVQDPHPPILVGIHGARGLRSVVGWGDEWLPGLGEIDTRLVELAEMAEAAGRPPIPTSYISIEPPDRALVEKLERLGVHRLLFKIPAEDAASAQERIDVAVAAAGA
jgi:probable F420-dependent oxidoreductase